jgi:hypothetical protein
MIEDVCLNSDSDIDGSKSPDDCKEMLSGGIVRSRDEGLADITADDYSPQL